MQGIKERAAVFQTILAKDKAANLFLLVALCTGIIIACINPPFHECDGWTHYIWATDVSYGNLLSPMLNLSSHKAGMVTVPENIAEVDYHITKSESGEGKVYSQYLNTVKFSIKVGLSYHLLTALSREENLKKLFCFVQAFFFISSETSDFAVTLASSSSSRRYSSTSASIFSDVRWFLSVGIGAAGEDVCTLWMLLVILYNSAISNN